MALPPQKQPDRFDRYWPRIVRISGLGLLLFEAGFERADRPYLLAAAIGMIFFEPVYRLQEKIRNGREDKQ